MHHPRSNRDERCWWEKMDRLRRGICQFLLPISSPYTLLFAVGITIANAKKLGWAVECCLLLCVNGPHDGRTDGRADRMCVYLPATYTSQCSQQRTSSLSAIWFANSRFSSARQNPPLLRAPLADIQTFFPIWPRLSIQFSLSLSAKVIFFFRLLLFTCHFASMISAVLHLWWDRFFKPVDKNECYSSYLPLCRGFDMTNKDGRPVSPLLIGRVYQLPVTSGWDMCCAILHTTAAKWQSHLSPRVEQDGKQNTIATQIGEWNLDLFSTNRIDSIVFRWIPNTCFQVCWIDGDKETSKTFLKAWNINEKLSDISQSEK